MQKIDNLSPEQDPQFKQGMKTQVISPFFNLLCLFLGAGFISGGIVHLGEGLNVWDFSLIILGISLFMLGSYLQEVRHNKKNIREEGMIPFLTYSLLLSIGIGMASGGTQHFIDTPEYSLYLLPIGLTIGVSSFVLKQNIKLQPKKWLILILSTLVGALIISAGLYLLSSILTESGVGHNNNDHHHEQLPSEQKSNIIPTNNSNHSH